MLIVQPPVFYDWEEIWNCTTFLQYLIAIGRALAQWKYFFDNPQNAHRD